MVNEEAANFKKQIYEDIREYQKRYSNISNLQKNEWAFNFWILDKFFNVEEEIIQDYITDYNDAGIDCYYFNEDTKELYIIQNKFYSENTKLSKNYILDDFLNRPLNRLNNDQYKRSPELQKIYNKYKNDKDFFIYLELYISNENIDSEIGAIIQKFNGEHDNVIARIYTLNKIKEKFYGELFNPQKQLEFDIYSVNKGTILNINTQDYHLSNPLDAKYIFTPVKSLFDLKTKSDKEKYPLFNDNIREYLGNKGINKKIYQTLLDDNEKRNFFYYNNGITMICDEIKPTNTCNYGKFHAVTKVINPQIVNGCQTVNSIYEALNTCNPSEVEEKFEDVFVMLKVLQINKNDEASNKLKNDIVRYNNSQNSIDERTFEAQNSTFLRLQQEFKKKGFLLCIKQSDIYKFSIEYKNISQLKDKNLELLEKYDLTDSMIKTKDFTIKLEKLLQVILAFISGGYQAYVKKPQLLKSDSNENKAVIDFIENSGITTQELIELYLLYLSSEKMKAKSNDERFPISYYLIDGFSKYQCNRQPNLIKERLKDSREIKKILQVWKYATQHYQQEYYNEKKIDYNKMIKQPIEYKDLEKKYEEGIEASEIFV